MHDAVVEEQKGVFYFIFKFCIFSFNYNFSLAVERVREWVVEQSTVQNR